MTSKQLWSKLDKVVRTEESIERAVEMMELIKQGYEQGLDILALGFIRNGGNSNTRGAFHQAYFDCNGGRLMICYTSRAKASKDWHFVLPEAMASGDLAVSEMGIRDMINNIFNKKVILGIVFNPDDEDAIIPKELMELIMPGEKPLPEFFQDAPDQ